MPEVFRTGADALKVAFWGRTRGLIEGLKEIWIELRGSVFFRGVGNAQVAERLMAADCKSAAPWSYGGSNPPLCTIAVRGWLG